MATRPCLIERCDKPAGVPGTGRGWCSTHYQRWKRHGDPTAEPQRGRRRCTIDGCEALVNGHGLCGKHYYRNRVHGTVEPRLRGQVVDGKRICPQCKQDLPLDAFCRNKSKPGGLTSYCRACEREKTRRWRAANPDYVQPRPPLEQIAAEAREYRRRNPERVAEISRSAFARRRAKKRGVKAEKFSNREIFERDGWVCQICHEPIDRDARAPHPLSPSIDHRIPLARHGEHTRENCRASHLRCNLRKHAKLEAA